MVKIPLSFLSTLVNSGSLNESHFCNYKGEVNLTFNPIQLNNHFSIRHREVINLITFTTKVFPQYSLCECNKHFVISKWGNYGA